MRVTRDRLEEFRVWLLSRGRSEGTVRLYTLNVATCSRHEDGLMGRLLERELAPKTLRTNLTALRLWADFTEDGQLAKRLKEILLPPAVRVGPRTELELRYWRDLIAAIRTAKERPPMKGILLLMATRGLRVGDVLRLRKREVAEALRTGTLSYEGKGRKRLEYSAKALTEPLEMIQDVQFGQRWDRVEDLVVETKATGLRRRKSAAASVTRALDRCAASVSIPDVYPHRLRRTYAVAFLKRLAGDPQALLKLQSHMGWASMTTAAGYVDAINRVELDSIGDDLTRDLGA